MKRLLVLLVVGLVYGSVASAAPAATPEELSRQYFQLLKGQRWSEIARLYDGSALADFRDMLSFLQELPDENASQALETFFGQGASRASVAALSDQEFFAGFFRGVMGQAARLGQLDFKRVDILGSVPEGTTVCHVVGRIHVGVGEITMESMEVISFRNNGDTWGILLQGKIKGMAQQIRKALAEKRP